MNTRIKVDHCGAKHGRGAFYGPKVVAKSVSKKLRRAIAKKEGRMVKFAVRILDLAESL